MSEIKLPLHLTALRGTGVFMATGFYFTLVSIVTSCVVHVIFGNDSGSKIRVCSRGNVRQTTASISNVAVEHAAKLQGLNDIC